MTDELRAAITIEQAREIIAGYAEADGEHVFAGEVRAGCWDHRRDVQAALAGRVEPQPNGSSQVQKG